MDAYSSTFHLQSISLTPYPTTIGTELENEGCAEYFYNKVGTRIVLETMDIDGDASPGGQLSLALTMVNAGYGRVIRQRPATLVLLQNDRVATKIPIPLSNMDLRTLQSSGPATFQFEFRLPTTLTSGPVSMELLIPDPAPSLSAQAAYALPLNSLDQHLHPIFDRATGYNMLAVFDVNCRLPADVSGSCASL